MGDTDGGVTENVLEEANRIVYGERAQAYGPPKRNFQVIADMWSAYLLHREPMGSALTAQDAAAMMVLLKTARICTGGFHRDSVVDIAGYAGVLERIFEDV